MTAEMQKTLESKSEKSRSSRTLGAVALHEGFRILDLKENPSDALRNELKSRIIDQQPAIDAVVTALERQEVRLDADHRPVANLAFLGPTGVGKSETAKVLAELMDAEGEGGNLIKIDCSNYSNGHEVSSLTGSPPGFVSREQKPLLSSDKVEKSGTVVLFDEIEKGSPELYHLMLQIMGDGELRLNNGKTTSFRDAVIIMTSNLGAKEMSRHLSETPLGFGKQQVASSKQAIESSATGKFEEFFSPEFVNRLNKMVVFHPLSADGLGKVLDTKLETINTEYEDRFGARISLTDIARDRLVGIASKEPHLGARPLIRALEDNVQSTFGRYVHGEMIKEGTQVRVIHCDELTPRQAAKHDSEFIFATKRDENLKIYRPPVQLPVVVVPAAEAQPEKSESDDMYSI